MKVVGLVANGDFLDHLAKHRNIGLTKTIDRLLGITNDEKANGIKRLIRVWAIAHEVGEDFPLQSSGVLEFINLDKAIAFFQVCDDGGRALEKPENAPGDGIKVVGVFLQAEGFIFTAIDNTKMEALRSQVNLAMLNNEILINKNETNFRDFWTYVYKNDVIDKNESSHIGDALCYGYRYLYPSSGFVGII